MNAAPAPIVAAFDFDGTLTKGDTLRPFLRRLLGWPTLLWILLVCSPWLVGYALRLVSNHRAKAALVHACLGRRWKADVDRCAEAFVLHDLPDLWVIPALRALVQHQEAGHHCVLVTASTSAYMHHVASSLGMDAVLCTELEVIHGQFSGHFASPNCHGEEKVRRLKAWLEENFPGQAPPELHAYGDTRGDLPMLALAEHAWYRGKPLSRGLAPADGELAATRSP